MVQLVISVLCTSWSIKATTNRGIIEILYHGIPWYTIGESIYTLSFSMTHPGILKDRLCWWITVDIKKGVEWWIHIIQRCQCPEVWLCAFRSLKYLGNIKHNIESIEIPWNILKIIATGLCYHRDENVSPGTEHVCVFPMLYILMGVLPVCSLLIDWDALSRGVYAWMH